ncbi:MAG: serine/threonine-protein kinase [Candidatus Eremiobacterota bacterium]
MIDRDDDGNLLPDIILNDKYKIIKLIHTGPVSRIYQGYDCKNKKNIFVKEITKYSDPFLSQQAVEQFKCEVKILFNLKHKSLPKFEDYFDYDDNRYLILEYIEGKKLTAFIENLREFVREKQIITWAIELCDFLLYLHTMKPNPIIFRDMNPSNIILSQDGTLKIIDFGISKIYESAGKTLGIAKTITPHYSPIEQHGESTDTRSDIYSLGATIYYLITRESPMDCINRTIDDEPMKQCSQINTYISPELERIVMKAMEIDRDLRYQDVKDMKSDLEKLAANEAGNKDTARRRPSGQLKKINFRARLNVKKEETCHDFKPVPTVNPVTKETGYVKNILENIKRDFRDENSSEYTKKREMAVKNFEESFTELSIEEYSSDCIRKKEFFEKFEKEEESSDSSPPALIEYVNTSPIVNEPKYEKQIRHHEKPGYEYITSHEEKTIRQKSLKDMLKSVSRKKKNKVHYDIPEQVPEIRPLPDIIGGRYKILFQLHCGANTGIYKCLDIETNEEVVIKELFVDDSLPVTHRKDLISQFRTVVGLFLKFNHPNLPRFQNYIESSGHRYLVMDFIDGKNLEDLIAELPGLPKEKQIIKWAIQICEVLSYLHSIKPSPVILRNLKPDNIFLDDGGNIRLLGFGLCKVMNPERETSPVIKMANLHYSPPEQYSGMTDNLTDIYSLGATLYYLTTKTHPLDAIDRLTTGSLVDILKYNHTISRKFTSIIQKAMNLKKSDRYQSIDELQDDLRAIH